MEDDELLFSGWNQMAVLVRAGSSPTLMGGYLGE